MPQNQTKPKSKNQTTSNMPRTMDSDAILQALEANSVNSDWRVLTKLNISQSSMVHYYRNLKKSIQSCQVVSCYQNIAKLLTHPIKI